MFKPKVYFRILMGVSVFIGAIWGALYTAGYVLEWLLTNYPQYATIVVTFVVVNILAFMIYVLTDALGED